MFRVIKETWEIWRRRRKELFESFYFIIKTRLWKFGNKGLHYDYYCDFISSIFLSSSVSRSGFQLSPPLSIHLPLFYKTLCVFLSSTDLTLSVILFRQPAGYIPPSHAALGEAHLCDLYWEDAGRELYCLHLPTMWVSQFFFFFSFFQLPCEETGTMVTLCWGFVISN